MKFLPSLSIAEKLLCFLFSIINDFKMGWDNAVDVTTPYGLDGLGIESQCGRFSAPFQTDPEANAAS
jgi:hypothetical protein